MTGGALSCHPDLVSLSLSFSSRPLFFRGRMFKAFSSSFFTCFYSNKQSRCHGFGSPPPRMMELLVNFCSLLLGYISIFLYIYIERSVLQWLLDYAAGCLWGFPFSFLLLLLLPDDDIFVEREIRLFAHSSIHQHHCVCVRRPQLGPANMRRHAIWA